MKQKKILVVDDSQMVRQQVASALQAAGFITVEAADGLEALERVAANDFSLIILDVNMPGLNGLDMLERLKADPKYAELPVVMLTTEMLVSLIERAKRAGARGWMIKPVKAEQLVRVATKLANGE